MLTVKADNLMGEEQMDSRTGRSTCNLIIISRQLVQKHREFNKKNSCISIFC